MTADQRRETIIRAALPPPAEHGTAVTTAQIARAAGIGEATVFRVFTDKNDVLRARITAALDPTAVLQQLQSISPHQPLAARLTGMGTVLGAVHAAGPAPNRSNPHG